VRVSALLLAISDCGYVDLNVGGLSRGLLNGRLQSRAAGNAMAPDCGREELPREFHDYGFVAEFGDFDVWAGKMWGTVAVEFEI